MSNLAQLGNAITDTNAALQLSLSLFTESKKINLERWNQRLLHWLPSGQLGHWLVQDGGKGRGKWQWRRQVRVAHYQSASLDAVRGLGAGFQRPWHWASLRAGHSAHAGWRATQCASASAALLHHRLDHHFLVTGSLWVALLQRPDALLPTLPAVQRALCPRGNRSAQRGQQLAAQHLAWHIHSRAQWAAQCLGARVWPCLRVFRHCAQLGGQVGAEHAAGGADEGRRALTATSRRPADRGGRPRGSHQFAQLEKQWLSD